MAAFNFAFYSLYKGLKNAVLPFLKTFLKNLVLLKNYLLHTYAYSYYCRIFTNN